MKKFRLNVAMLALYVLGASSANAQIWLQGDNDLYLGGNTTMYNHGINVKDFPGFYWQSNQTFMQLDMTNKHPHFSFSNNEVLMPSTCYSGNMLVLSDSLVKENVRTIQDGDDILKALIPIAKVSKESLYRPTNQLRASAKAKARFALDIESLQSNLPQCVTKLSKDMVAIDYTMLVPVLVNGIQKMQEQINSLQSEIDKMEKVQRTFYNTDILKMTRDAGKGKYVVTYVLPEECKNAFLQVCDKSGKQVDILDVSKTNSAVLDDNEIGVDTGYVSLLIDGELAGVSYFSSVK